MKYSPDRLDAMVWAMTDLAIEARPGENVLDYYRLLDAKKSPLAVTAKA